MKLSHIYALPMKPLRSLARLTVLLVTTCSTLETFALPFKKTPSSFSQYANTIEFGNGYRHTFSGFYGCKYFLSNTIGSASAYPGSGVDSRNPYAQKAQEYLDDYYKPIGSRQLTRGWTPEEFDSRYAQMVKESDSFANRGEKAENYSCIGFLTLTSPKGTKVCDAYIKFDGTTRQVSYVANKCVWK